LEIFLIDLDMSRSLANRWRIMKIYRRVCSLFWIEEIVERYLSCPLIIVRVDDSNARDNFVTKIKIVVFGVSYGKAVVIYFGIQLVRRDNIIHYDETVVCSGRSTVVVLWKTETPKYVSSGTAA